MTENTVAKKNIIGFTELKTRYLPHGYPMLLLDRVTDYKVGEYIHGIKAITGNSPDIVGHYPNERSIMPGTNITQSFAQLAIVFFKLSTGELKDDEMTLITASSARYLAPAFPGDLMEMTMTPKKMTRMRGIFVAEAKVGDKVVCKGQLTLVKVKSAIFEGSPW